MNPASIAAKNRVVLNSASNAIASQTFQQDRDLDVRDNQLGVATIDDATTAHLTD